MDTSSNNRSILPDGHSRQSRITTRQDSMVTPEEDLSREAVILKRSHNECVFFKLLHAEMNKAIQFFEEKQLQYQLRMGTFQGILEDAQELQGEDQQAFAQKILLLHQDLLCLETFSIMSYCAFSKILKKHDKVTGFHTRNAFMAKVVHPASITHTPQLQGMIQKCQDWLTRMVDERLEDQEQRPSETDQQLFWDSIQKLKSSSSSSTPSLVALLTREEAQRPFRNWSAALALNAATSASQAIQQDLSDSKSSGETVSASQIHKKRKLSELEIAS